MDLFYLTESEEVETLNLKSFVINVNYVAFMIKRQTVIMQMTHIRCLSLIELALSALSETRYFRMVVEG